MSTTDLSTAASGSPPAQSIELPRDLPGGHLEIEVSAEHIDSLGHVNNAVYVKYFERGRVAFYAQLGLALESDRPPRIGTVVVNLNVNYRDECVAGDHLHLVTRGLGRGNRSFIVQQHLARQNGTPVADCTATSVIMDLDTRTVEELPDALAVALPPRRSET